MPKKRKYAVSIAKFIFLIIVIYAMITYQVLILSTKGKVDLETGDVIEQPTVNQKLLGYFFTFVYSLVVIIFGTLYKYLANL